VVTVGALQAGEANNVIPASATLELSVRALDREVRATLRAAHQGAGGAQAKFRRDGAGRLEAGYAVLVNTPAETAFAREVATRTGRRGAASRCRARR
jgi:hippurate hydrolase